MSEKELIDALIQKIQDPGCLILLEKLQTARKETYKAICVAIDNQICGDIFQIQHGKSDTVLAVGTDGIKNIIFEQMGFGPDDMLELN